MNNGGFISDGHRRGRQMQAGEKNAGGGETNERREGIMLNQDMKKIYVLG